MSVISRYNYIYLAALFSVCVDANNGTDDADAIEEGKAVEDDIEILVVSASGVQEKWLNSAASVQRKRADSSALLIDSAQLISSFAGIQADSRANFAQDTRVSLRGFGSRSAFGIRGLYLQQDGIPLTTPDGQGHLSSVLLDQISTIEVLRGPLAVLYGNGAGGVISLYSKEPVQPSLQASSALSNVHKQHQLHGQWVSGNHSGSAALKHFNTDGYRAHSAAEKRQALLQWQSDINDSYQLKLRYDYSDDPQLQDPLGLSVAQWQEDPQQIASGAQRFDTEKHSQQNQLSISLSAITPQPGWQLALWQGQRNIGQRLAFPGRDITSSGGIIALQRDYRGIKANYPIVLSTEWDIQLGTSYVQSEDKRQGYVNEFGQQGELRRNEVNQANNTDAYFRFNWQAAPNLQLQGGLRHSWLTLDINDFFIVDGNPDDNGGKTFSEPAMALGLSYQFRPMLSWFISTGKGFETPTLTEVAYRSDGNGLNLDLNASSNVQWETGVKWQQQQLNAAITFFDIRTKDELLVDTSEGGRTSYRNAAETRRQGIELQMDWRHSERWQQQLSAHVLSARFNTDNDNYLPGVAARQVNWQLSYSPWQYNARFALRGHYRSGVYIDDDNSERAPASITFSINAKLEQHVSQWQFSQWLALDNLTDRQYVGSVIVNQRNGRAFEPAPGRQLSAGVKVKYLW